MSDRKGSNDIQKENLTSLEIELEESNRALKDLKEKFSKETNKTEEITTLMKDNEQLVKNSVYTMSLKIE